MLSCNKMKIQFWTTGRKAEEKGGWGVISAFEAAENNWSHATHLVVVLVSLKINTIFHRLCVCEQVTQYIVPNTPLTSFPFPSCSSSFYPFFLFLLPSFLSVFLPSLVTCTLSHALYLSCSESICNYDLCFVFPYPLFPFFVFTCLPLLSSLSLHFSCPPPSLGLVSSVLLKTAVVLIS